MSVDRMPPERRKATRWELAALVAIVVAAASIRLGALPSRWNADSCFYVESILSGADGAGPGPRESRRVFLWCVEGALRLGAGSPAWASLPGILSSLAAIPCLWLALRDRAPPFVALAPAVVWAVLPVDLQQSTQVSSDAVTAGPAALAVAAVALASARRNPWSWLVTAGVAAGTAALLKETAALLLPAIGAGAAVAVPRGARLRAAVTVSGIGALVLLCGTLLLSPGRLESASAHVAAAPWAVRPDDAGFGARMTIGLAALLLTNAYSFGVLFAVLLPCLVRLPFLALRGSPLAVTALGGLLVAQFAPVSLSGPSFLPFTGHAARFLVWLLPALVAASVEAAFQPPRSRLEWIVAGTAAFAGLAIVGTSPAAAGALALAAALAWWSWRPGGGETSRVLAAYLAAVAAAPAIAPWSPHAPVLLAAAGVLAAAVGPRLGLGRAGCAACALALGGASSMATLAPTLRADPLWRVWDAVPREGELVAAPPLHRRLRLAARLPGRDDARIRGWDPADGLPVLRPEDRWVVEPEPASRESIVARHRVVSDRGGLLVLAPQER